MYCGNSIVTGYKDNSGSVSRRCAVFYWRTLVKVMDTTLESKIVKGELVYILLPCLQRYKAKQAQTAGFWTLAPQQLRDNCDEVKQASNHLANFLAKGDQYYQILHCKGMATSLEDLGKAFSNHMRIVHKVDKATLGHDHHPIKAAGFIIERKNLCKECHRPCARENCGAHFDTKNRYRKLMIQDMYIKRSGHVERTTFL